MGQACSSVVAEIHQRPFYLQGTVTLKSFRGRWRSYGYRLGLTQSAKLPDQLGCTPGVEPKVQQIPHSLRRNEEVYRIVSPDLRAPDPLEHSRKSIEVGTELDTLSIKVLANYRIRKDIA
jgi:hypothetical protein